MSKVVKTVARIALPIAGAVFGGPIGGAIGGAVAGAMGGGGVKGAVLGGVTGYLGAGAAKSLVGTAASIPTGAVQGAPYYGSGIKGALTGGGLRALGSTVSGAAAGVVSDPSKLLIGVGNQLMAEEGSDAAIKAAEIQSRSIDKGIAANKAAQLAQQQTLAPYTESGAGAVTRLDALNADPAGYIASNPLYASLAKDAERRLFANQAAKGKVGSGETAAALQEQLLNLGTGLINQDRNAFQNQIQVGANAAAGVGTGQLNTGATNADLLTSQGGVNAAGQVGSYNAMKEGYQNQINTLLALQGLNKAPIYSPTIYR